MASNVASITVPIGIKKETIMTVDVAGIATEVATIDEKVMAYLPEIAMLAGFIPGAAPVVAFEPLVLELLAAIDTAAKDVAASNPGAAFQDIVTAITNHLAKGKPLSPALT